jgi:hypothetical protein
MKIPALKVIHNRPSTADIGCVTACKSMTLSSACANPTGPAMAELRNHTAELVPISWAAIELNRSGHAAHVGFLRVA